MASNFKAEFAFLDRYKKMYLEKYGKAIDINKYKEKWAVSSLFEDYTHDTVYECLDYYFRGAKDGHPLTYFFFNFEQIKAMMDDQHKDEQMRLERRKKTQDLVKEYLNGVQ